MLLFLTPPALHSAGSVVTKLHADQLQLSTLPGLVELLVGSGRTIVVAVVGTFAGIGLVALTRRDRLLTTYLLTVIAAQLAALVAAGPLMLHVPIVAARYLVIVLPLLWVFPAVGVVAVARRVEALAAQDPLEVEAPGFLQRDLVAEGKRVAEDRDPYRPGRSARRRFTLRAQARAVRMSAPVATSATGARCPAEHRVIDEKRIVRGTVACDRLTDRCQRNAEGAKRRAEQPKLTIAIGPAEGANDELAERERDEQDEE
jgi:hypothetical protein